MTSYKNSTFARFPVILTALQERDMRPEDLFKKVKSKTFDAAEFIEVLDCLYILGKIDFLPGREVLHYVG